ncbi:MAG: endo-1,3-alpha-glucanase family glycosylhydrolase [Verrucomicrobiota bacterium]
MISNINRSLLPILVWFLFGATSAVSEVILQDEFSDGNFTSGPAWTISAGSWSVVEGGVKNGAFSANDYLSTSDFAAITHGVFSVSVRVRFSSASVSGNNRIYLRMRDSTDGFKGYEVAIAQSTMANTLISGISGGTIGSQTKTTTPYAFPVDKYVTINWTRTRLGEMVVSVAGQEYLRVASSSISVFDTFQIGGRGLINDTTAYTYSFDKIQVETGDVLFEENFDNNTAGRLSLAAASPGWEVYGGFGARNFSTNSGIVYSQNEPGTRMGGNGYVVFNMGAVAESATTDRFVAFKSGLNIASRGATIFWDFNSYANSTYNRLLLQLDGRWYIHNTVFNPRTGVGNWSPDLVRYQNGVVFDTAADDWSEITIIPGSVVSIGAPLAQGLGELVAITGIGLYVYNASTTSGTGVLLDSMVVMANSELVPGSAEGLIKERFDEYKDGAPPPDPWRVTGGGASNVSLTLDVNGQSPFIKNQETGKGIVVIDTNPLAGHNKGISVAFSPPPPGRLYFGSDFQTIGPIDLSSGLGFTCELTDKAGDGMQLRVGDGAVLLAGLVGEAQPVVSLSADTWYHVAMDFAESGEATITLTEYLNPTAPIAVVTIPPLAGGRQRVFEALRFYSAGADAGIGGWAVDNICMAGEVDSPRRALLPFEQLPLAQLRASSRKVFAYYYEIYTSGYSPKDPGLTHYAATVLNPTYVQAKSYLADRVGAGTEIFYHPLTRPRMESGLTDDEVLIRAAEDEVRVALLAGLDGFFTDFFASPSTTSGGQATFNARSFAVLAAAARVDPGFKIVPTIYAGADPEGATSAETAANYANSPVVRQALTHPQALRFQDGRVAFTMWDSNRRTPEWWAMVLANLEAQGIHAAFIGYFNGRTWEQLQPYASVCSGMVDWGPRSPSQHYQWVPRVRDITPLVISPIVLQDQRTRGCEYWESGGSELLRKTWSTAIDELSDWTILTTWSDYTEQAMAPSTAIGYAPHDLNAYYIQWFKTGQPPPISRDVLYYFYRRHHSSAIPALGQMWTARENSAPTADEIEVLGFLTAPGELRIKIGGTTHTLAAGAGITSFKVPMPAGLTFAPVFSLVRDGRTVVLGQGRYSVLDQIEYANFLYHSGVLPAPSS